MGILCLIKHGVSKALSEHDLGSYTGTVTISINHTLINNIIQVGFLGWKPFINPTEPRDKAYLAIINS